MKQCPMQNTPLAGFKLVSVYVQDTISSPIGNTSKFGRLLNNLCTLMLHCHAYILPSLFQPELLVCFAGVGATMARRSTAMVDTGAGKYSDFSQ